MERKVLSVLFALVLLLTLGLVTAVPAGAATINVEPGPGAIQDAINAASDGDIINVAEGTYTENVDVNKRVILQASGAVTVNPTVTTDHIFHVTESNVTIDRFTLVGDTLDSTSRGILLEGVTGCTISNNNYSRTNAAPAIAIYLGSADSNIVQGNTLTFSAGETGISVQSSDYNLIKNNTITLSGVGQTILVEGSNDNTIQGNTLDGNSVASGIAVHTNVAVSDGNTVKGNTFTDCNFGVGIRATATNAISNTSIEGNTMTGCANAVNLDSSGGALANISITKNTCQSGTSSAIAVVESPTGSSITISQNDISDNVRGIYIGPAADANLVTASPDNSIVESSDLGVNNLGAGTLDATGNWWGTAVGADIPAMLEGDVDYASYLTTAPTAVGLTVEPDILPTVATSAADPVSFTSATLNGNLSDIGTASQVDVWFEWGTTTSYGTTTSFETKTGIDTFTAGLTGLTEDTDYHFRAVARSADGTTTGADASFHTPPIIVAPAVTTQAATSVDLYSATLNANLDDLGSASSVMVSFGYGITQGGPYTIDTTPAAMSSTGAFSAGITSLTHDTTYYFQAKAVGDLTVYGAELSFTTVAEIIGISVSPTSIDFGSILAGSSSGTKTVTVTNEGNVAEDFTAELIDELPVGFYTANLVIDSSAVTGWSATDIPVDTAATPGLVLSIPDGATAGPKTATLVFWAIATP